MPKHEAIKFVQSAFLRSQAKGSQPNRSVPRHSAPLCLGVALVAPLSGTPPSHMHALELDICQKTLEQHDNTPVRGTIIFLSQTGFEHTCRQTHTDSGQLEICKQVSVLDLDLRLPSGNTRMLSGGLSRLRWEAKDQHGSLLFQVCLCLNARPRRTICRQLLFKSQSHLGPFLSLPPCC